MDDDCEPGLLTTSSTKIGNVIKLRATAAVMALALLIYNLHEKGRKLHVSHSHGSRVARFFEEDDPMRQGAEGERLKRAIKAEKEEQDRKNAAERKPGRSSRGGGSRLNHRSGGRYDRDRDYSDREFGGGGRNSGSTRRCYICDSKEHLSNDCPKRRRS